MHYAHNIQVSTLSVISYFPLSHAGYILLTWATEANIRAVNCTVYFYLLFILHGSFILHLGCNKSEILYLWGSIQTLLLLELVILDHYPKFSPNPQSRFCTTCLVVAQFVRYLNAHYIKWSVQASSSIHTYVYNAIRSLKGECFSLHLGCNLTGASLTIALSSVTILGCSSHLNLHAFQQQWCYCHKVLSSQS